MRYWMITVFGLKYWTALLVLLFLMILSGLLGAWIVEMWPVMWKHPEWLSMMPGV